MGSFSRVWLVGIVLGLGVVVAACQPVRPVAEAALESGTRAPAANATIPATSEVVTATASAVTTSVAATETMTETVTVTPAASDPLTTVDPALLATGLAAYRAQYCGVCHQLDAAETRGTFGPPHNGMAATAALHLADVNYSGTATTPAEYVLESIVDPQAFIVPGYATTSHRMPPYAHLDAATLEALVAFLMAQ